MQDLNDLVFFAEVVDRGGFAAAGRSLGLPKSRLSRRVAELESRLGVRLLQRTTRRLSLTSVGEQYHRHCVAMRENALAADEAIARAQHEPQGTIRVACPVTLAQTTLGPLFPEFMARYPKVRLDVRVSNRVVDLVEEGFDVAFRVRPSLEASGSLVVKRFGLSRPLLVASPVQLERQGHPTTVAELARLDTLSMSGADVIASWQLTGPNGETEQFESQPRYVADDLLTLKFAAIRGVGMAALPDYMCREDIHEGRLVAVLPQWMLPQGIFHAVFPSRRGLIPTVRKFLDFLGEMVVAEGEVTTRAQVDFGPQNHGIV